MQYREADMNRAIAKGLFLALERVRGERVDLYLTELEHNQRESADVIRQIQRNKLATLLQYVVVHNDFYRQKFRSHDPLNNFTDLPVLGKQELREHFKEVVTPERAATVGLVKTSGSTGEPLTFYRDRIVFGYTLASVYRAHRWYGIDIGAKEAMLWGIPAAWRSRLTMRVRDLMLNRFRESEYNLAPTVLEKFYRDLCRKRPEYVYGYSSMVYEFALFVKTQRLPTWGLQLKAVICTAEMLHDYQRELIEAVFGCGAVSEYGSAETGVISYECPSGSHHVSDDCVLVEVVDENGQPLPPGVVGRVTVTVLHSFAAPIIRYQLGDYASLRATPCGCGVNLSVIEKLVGRTSGVIVTPAGRCHHSIAVYYIMKGYADKFGGVRQFRVRQTHIDRLEFHVAASESFTEESQGWIKREAQRTFGDSMRIEFYMHDQIERSRSGKLTDFESTLDMEDHLIASFRRDHAVSFDVAP